MKKLHNRRGATILMALLLLLLATMVSAVILTAVSSAARRQASDRQAQQNYLTVSSAADLLRGSILNDSYKRVVTEITTYTYDENHVSTGSDTTTTTIESGLTGLMGQWLKDGITRAENGFTDSLKDTISLTVSAPATGDADGAAALKTVEAAFEMDENLDVTIRLSIPDSGDNDCRMTLTLKGTKMENTLSSSNETSSIRETTTIVTWGSSRITKGAT